VNRAERRHNHKARVRMFANPGDMVQAARCPDCDSDVTITEISPGVYRGQVEHDDSCPWYAELRRDLS
jgi:hypothetical protein